MMKRLRTTIVFCGLAALTLTGGAAKAGEIACGGEYLSQQGDTIYSIASKAYPAGVNRQLFVSLVSQRLGHSNAVLEENTRLPIPCESATGLNIPASYWSGEDLAPMRVKVTLASLNALAAENDRKTPSIMQDLMDRAASLGLVTVQQAGATGAVSADLPFEGGSLASYPWRKSDCVGDAARSPLCASGLWSEPIYDITSGAYSIEGKAAIATAGAPTCLAGESRQAVSALGSASGAILQLAIIDTTVGCIARLRSGDVAVAIMPDVAAIAENQAGERPPLVRAFEFSVSDTVHVVFDPRKSESRTALTRINNGVEKLRMSGEWFQIVRAHLTSGYLN